MKAQTLMLITDISGYTRFITRVGHEEGVKRAQEMLQVIINANTLGLKLCEIEGDAVFFYTMKIPSRISLLRQISRTYQAFSDYLANHHLENELGIKFFVHTGTCEEIKIGGRTKLYGTEVIKIHRLLKSITSKGDSLLVTKSALAALEFEPEDGLGGDTEFPYIGLVSYTTFQEEYLIKHLKPSLYRAMGVSAKEVGALMISELGKQYRRYASIFHPLHELAS